VLIVVCSDVSYLTTVKGDLFAFGHLDFPIDYHVRLLYSGRIMRGPEGAWPPERPDGPLETPGLRGYKGASKRPPWNHPSNSIHDCNISISISL